MKYDIIYDDGADKWTLDKTYGVHRVLKDFCKSFADEHERKPEIAGITLGLDCWYWLTLHGWYNHVDKTIPIYDLIVHVAGPDWTVNNNYIELVLL